MGPGIPRAGAHRCSPERRCIGFRLSRPGAAASGRAGCGQRNNSVQFRQKALSKLQSPEELDVPVHLARPQGRLVLAVTVVVMAVACFWAVTGSVSPELSAP